MLQQDDNAGNGNTTGYPNLDFYRNVKKFEPNGDFIEIVLEWRGDYNRLEHKQGYIQWLFPMKTTRLNGHAFRLKSNEAKIIRETPILKERVKRAFCMMLEFYGMILTRQDQFELSDNAEERLKILNKLGNPNFRHISRIITSLQLLGHTDLVLPWMKFLAHLIYNRKSLDKADHSFKNYWLGLLNTNDSAQLLEYIKSLNIRFLDS